MKQSQPQQTAVMQSIICKFLLNLPPFQIVQDRIWLHFSKAYYYYIDHVHKSKPEGTFDCTVHQNLFFQQLANCFPQNLVMDHKRIRQMINSAYEKTPVCGVILLNETQDKALIVQSVRNPKQYGFPKGKINEGETLQACAQRELFEQLGLKISVADCKKIVIKNGKSTTFFVSKINENKIQSMKANQQINSVLWVKIYERITQHLTQTTIKALSKLTSEKKSSQKSIKNLESAERQKFEFKTYDRKNLRDIFF